MTMTDQCDAAMKETNENLGCRYRQDINWGEMRIVMTLHKGTSETLATILSALVYNLYTAQTGTSTK